MIETLDRIAGIIGWLVISAITFFLIGVVLSLVLSLLKRGGIAAIERAAWRIGRIPAVQRWVDRGLDTTRSDREP